MNNFNLINEFNQNWCLEKLKRVVEKNTRGVSPKYESDENKKENPIINQACVYNNHLRLDRVKYNSVSSKNSKGELEEDDILICSTGGGTVGRVGFWNVNLKNYVADSHVTILRFKKDKKPKYFFYLLSSKEIGEQINGCIKGATNQEELSNYRLNEIYVFVPPKEEQTAIANYLDEKTDVIDKAIDELKNQKRLLQELKKTTIHQAITKGLDPNVPMKDSGVEWIGEVPEHWKVTHLKKAINYTTGNTPSSNNENFYSGNSLFYWANICDLNKKFLKETKQKISSKGIASKSMKKVPSNSLLFSFKLSVGNCSITKIDTYTNEAIAAFKENKNINVNWFYYFMSTLFKNNSKENIYGAKILNRHLIENGFVLLPPKNEQKQMAMYLNEKICKIDNSINEIDKQVEYLQEYKKTLINDAVTGKIKVYEGED